MEQYLQNLCKIIARGSEHSARTKTNRISIFGELSETYDHADGFPVVTTRKIFVKTMVAELLWFLRGNTNINDEGAPPNIWNSWAVGDSAIENHAQLTARAIVPEESPDYGNTIAAVAASVTNDMAPLRGTIGPMYGHTWRSAPMPGDTASVDIFPYRTIEQLPSDRIEKWMKLYEEYCYLSQTTYPGGFEAFANRQYYSNVDQINELILNLKARPHSSRHVVTAWIPGYIPPENIEPSDAALQGWGALAPCHAMFQFYVRVADGVHYLDLLMYQRSVDYPVGRPFNIAQYGLLQAMIAHCTGMTPGKLFLPTGDAHIYSDQLELAKLQITRTPLKRPTLWLNPDVRDIFKFTPDDIRFDNYEHHPVINYPKAV